jgi:hypothetical protein
MLKILKILVFILKALEKKVEEFTISVYQIKKTLDTLR